MKRCLCVTVAIMLLFVGNSFTLVNASNLNTSTTESYTAASTARDVDGYYSFSQGSVVFQGYGKNVWPSGRMIYYTPYTSDYTQAGVTCGLSSRGASSGGIYYNSGYGYRANYRAGAHTSSGRVDTTFSFYE